MFINISLVLDFERLYSSHKELFYTVEGMKNAAGKRYWVLHILADTKPLGSYQYLQKENAINDMEIFLERGIKMIEI